MNKNREWPSPNQERTPVSIFTKVSEGEDGWETETVRLFPDEIEQKKLKLTKLLEEGKILDFSMDPGMEADTK